MDIFQKTPENTRKNTRKNTSIFRILVFFLVFFLVFLLISGVFSGVSSGVFLVFSGVFKSCEFSKNDLLAIEEIKSYLDPLAGIPRY